MEVKAQLKHLRMSPRKVRLVANLLKGTGVIRAENQLKFLPKRATSPLLKLLKSAVANAENNHNLKKSNLYVSRIAVDGGPVLKRMRPRAFGRAAQILKRTSHVNLVLGVREGHAEETVSRYAPAKRETVKEVSEEELKKIKDKQISEKPKIKKYGEKPKLMKKSTYFVRRMFRRKAI